MKDVFQKIESFFLQNTFWIFLSVLGVVSYILVEIFQVRSYSVYFSYLLPLCLVFSPILIFSLFRDVLKQKLPDTLYWMLWGICFIGYTLGISFFNFDWLQIPYRSLVTVDIHFQETFLQFIGSTLLITELAIFSNGYFLQKIRNSNWIKKINLEKGILLTLFLLAMLLAATNNFTQFADSTPYQISNSQFKNNTFAFFYLTLQFSLAFLAYYFFYYINHYFLIPKLLKSKGIIYYGFGVAASILFFYPLLGLFLAWMPIAQVNSPDPTLFQNINQIMNYGGIPFLVMVLSVPLILINQWFQQNAAIANLEKEKSETELSLLKQQINPHFFFNTLNNLYALSITKDEQTPEVIMQLSELMRYVIYKGKENTVSLREEVKYIEDYIQLQQIRLHKNLDFRFEKNIQNPELRVPPLLFIVLVENAFKHGIEPAEEHCYLQLHLESDQDSLTFICKNSFEGKLEEGDGIGLSNLKRRLELRFPNQHEIRIEEGENHFQVSLKLFEV